MILIGYSGHGFVVYGIFKAAGVTVTSYCDNEEKVFNPFNLEYLGKDDEQVVEDRLKKQGFFISIGNNLIRRRIQERMMNSEVQPANAIHPSAIIDPSANISGQGIMISAKACINPLASISNGVICNTGCIIEHECVINDYAHIGPGAVLCGNVKIGSNSFVGAGSVIREGVVIGNNVMIGAGTIVVKNIMDNETVVGNPSRIIKKIN